eukprot:jgi/Mesvir1/14896/Mv05499-RA.1
MMADAAAVSEVQGILDQVYGPYFVEGEKWRPMPFTQAGRGGRYLGSDTFGVINFLSLHYALGGDECPSESQWLAQAIALVEEVHDVLGRDRHTGHRLPPATDAQPLLGGLRIGKAEEECDAQGRINPEGDGQYFHYLAKWMFALNRVARATGDGSYNDQAVTLAKVAHRAFLRNGAGSRTHASGATSGPTSTALHHHMVSKMSVDLKLPLVASEGHLDPYCGLVTYRLLAASVPVERRGPDNSLEDEIKDFAAMVYERFPKFDSLDPLTLGGALWLTSWADPDERWVGAVKGAAEWRANDLFRLGHFSSKTHSRLLFREMGLTLGLQASLRRQLYAEGIDPKWATRVDQLHDFWRPHLYERDADISPLMFAASVLPGVWVHRHHAPPE